MTSIRPIAPGFQKGEAVVLGQRHLSGDARSVSPSEQMTRTGRRSRRAAAHPQSPGGLARPLREDGCRDDRGNRRGRHSGGAWNLSPQLPDDAE